MNEEEVILELLQRLDSVFKKISQNVEYIFIDDGSTDATFKILKEQAKKNPQIKILKFSRNFGHHIAIFAGIEHAKGKHCILMDGDLQDPPEEIPNLIFQMQNTNSDIVYAIRKNRKDGFLKKLSSKIFWKTINLLSDFKIPEGQSVFRIFNHKVKNSLNKLQETQRFLAGLFAWVGFSSSTISILHQPRKHGKSKYNLTKTLRQALDAVLSFSHKPLRMISYFGMLVSCSSFIFGTILIFRKLIFATKVEGWTSLIVTIFFALGVQLICLGVIAEYIARIFKHTQKRPLYLLEESVSYEEQS